MVFCVVRMEPADYKSRRILARSLRTGAFDENCVGSCHVIGVVAEASLKLAYRPKVGCLPCPVLLQSSEMFPSVDFHDVLLQGEATARTTLNVKVYATDADRALSLLRALLTKLQSYPYHLEVLSVDHTGGTSCPTAHDILASPRIGASSCLEPGLYSIELRCREVKSKILFDWEGVLTSEAVPLFSAEQRKKRKTVDAKLSGRILAFACFPSPCHSQPETLHASIYYGSSAGWQRLWGWSGFRAPENVEAEPIAKAKAKPEATAKAKAKVLSAPVARTNVKTPQEQWQLLSAKKGMDGAWIQLPKYLTHLKLPKKKSEARLS